MKNFFAYLLIVSILFPSHIFAAGRIQDSDVKSLTDVGGAASRLINTSKIYDVTNLQQLSTSIANGQLGGAGGSGGINYASANTGFETTVAPYVAYADTAGSAAPITASGGTPTVTITRSTVTPLRGNGSGLFTHPASNVQGQGFALPITIDKADQSKVLTLTADYSVDSGTYADGDLTAYVVDVTNSQVIQPVGYKIFSVASGTYGKISATFQTSNNSTSYRIAFHVATPSTAAYALKFDNISVGPQAVAAQGAIITNYTSFTPVLTSTGGGAYVFGTGGSATAEWVRIGSEAVVKYRFVNGSSGNTDASAGSYIVNYPPSVAPDVTGAGYTAIGFGDVTNSSTANPVARLIPKIYSSTGFILDKDETTLLGAGAGQFNFANSIMTITVRYKVPGWGALASMGGADDARQMAVRSGGATGTIANGGGAQVVQFVTPTTDTHSAWDAVNKWVKIPSPGQYEFGAYIDYATASTGLQAIRYKVNGGTAQVVAASNGLNQYQQIGGSESLPFNAGDTLQFTADNGHSGALSIDGARFYVRKSPGNATIAAAESVNAKYTTTSFSGATGIIILTNKVGDSHNGYNTTTGVYTFPTPGTYEVTGLVQSAAVSFAVGGFFEAYVSVNGAGAVGTNLLGGNRVESTLAINRYAGGNTLLYNIKAGDTASLYLNSSTSNSLVLTIMNIKKVGN